MQAKTKTPKKLSPFAIVLGVILAVYAVILLGILLYGFMASVKTYDDYWRTKNFFGLPRQSDGMKSGRLLWPWEWEWKNYSLIFKYLTVKKDGYSIGIDMQILYTFLYAGGCGLLGTLCPCIMAYATSKFRYKFNKVIDGIVIISMIIPIVGSQVSMVSLLYKFGLYDTFPGLWIQKFSFANMYYLVFAAIFKGVSREYYEAAHIDGASEFGVMIRVALPLVVTSFGLVFLLYFIQYWNDYQTLLIYAPTHPSLVYGLFDLTKRSSGTSLELGKQTTKMAGTFIVVLPVIALFIIFRNKLMGNVTIGGVKE